MFVRFNFSWGSYLEDKILNCSFLIAKLHIFLVSSSREGEYVYLLPLGALQSCGEPIKFVQSARPPARMEKLEICWTDFQKFDEGEFYETLSCHLNFQLGRTYLTKTLREDFTLSLVIYLVGSKTSRKQVPGRN
jgi:hypothetical protein